MTLDEERPFSFSLLCEVNSIKNGLSTYVDLSHEVEKMLNAKEEQSGEQLAATLNRVPSNQHQDVHESYALDLHTYESTFRFLQREAMFLTLYNYFEHFLNKLCDWIGDEIVSRVRLKDIQGKGIERALLFLKLVPEFSFANIPSVMEVIRGANQLRNIIVHAGAILPEDPNLRSNQFVRSHPRLGGEPGNPVSLQNEFIPAFADTLTHFFTELESEMQRYMNRTWRDSPLLEPPRVSQ
jgi:hypothetical protein